MADYTPHTTRYSMRCMSLNTQVLMKGQLYLSYLLLKEVVREKKQDHTAAGATSIKFTQMR